MTFPIMNLLYIAIKKNSQEMKEQNTNVLHEIVQLILNVQNHIGTALGDND